MHRRAVLSTLLLTAVGQNLAACAGKQDSPKNWRSVGLPGSVLILQSESKVEEIRFVGEAWAVVTLGTKGGPMTGPIFPWGFDNDRLSIGQIGEYELLAFVAMVGRRVKARRRSGELVEYDLLKP